MSLLQAFRSCAALFITMVTMVIGHGLIGSLLGLRLLQEGYSTGTAGLVMAGLFLGLVIGALIMPRLIARVGHVRVYAAMSALTSLIVLAQSQWVDPWVWFGLRIVTGATVAGLYIVIESWLNDRAENSNRGGLTAIYMVLFMLAMGIGQLLLSVTSPLDDLLFLLSAGLYVLSLVPLALSISPEPTIVQPQPFSIAKLYRRSRTGTVSAMMIGLLHGTLIGMTAVYGEAAGFDLGRVSLLSAAIYVGGILLCFPVGRLSDFMERRLVLAVVALLVTVFCGLAVLAQASGFWLLLISLALAGGLSQPLYSLCLAVTHDRLTREERVSASATLYLVIGLASSVGPPLCGFMMEALGAIGFFYYLGSLHALLGGYALYRSLKLAPAKAQVEVTAAAAAMPPPPPQRLEPGSGSDSGLVGWSASDSLGLSGGDPPLTPDPYGQR
ncbi:MAG: MFS transporter [Rhodospirillales bacterium]